MQKNLSTLETKSKGFGERRRDGNGRRKKNNRGVLKFDEEKGRVLFVNTAVGILSRTQTVQKGYIDGKDANE